MKTPVDIFDEWLKLSKQRPRLHPIPIGLANIFSDQLKLFDRRMATLRQMFLPNRSIDLYADFINSGRCNAGAGILHGLGLVGITKGAIMLPIETFLRILSHPDALDGIGDGRLERVGPQHSEGMPEDYNKLVMTRLKTGRPESPVHPVDPIRQIVAQMCIQMSWSFLVFHEIVHIVHGHFGYLHKTNAISCILEIQQSAAPITLSQDDLDYQAIEFWADNKAITVVLNGFLKGGVEPTDTILPEPEQKIFIWSFAIYTFFRIWGLEVDPGNLAGHTHPPTALRFQIAMISAHSDISKLLPHMRADRIWEIIHAGQREADHCIGLTGGRYLNMRAVRGVQDPRCVAHRDQLLDHMQDVLVPELRKYSYISLHDA